MTSNATRSTKTKSGGPNYKVQYDNLQLDIAIVRNKLAASKAKNANLTDEIAKQDSKIATKEEYIDMLHVEASQSECNLQERNYYKLCSWGWGTAAVLLAASWIFFAVKL